MERRRYSGGVTILISFTGQIDNAGRGEYAGTMTAGPHRWEFSRLWVHPVSGRGYDHPETIDRAAEDALSFGSFYTSDNRGEDAPEWAPPADFADACDMLASRSPEGWDVGFYPSGRDHGGPVYIGDSFVVFRGKNTEDKFWKKVEEKTNEKASD